MVRMLKESRNFHTNTVDLSIGGVCVELTLPVQRNAPVTVEIPSPAHRTPLVFQGTIAWSRAWTGPVASRAGIRFEHQEADALGALWEVLESAKR